MERIDNYYNEMINYGGILTPRYKVIEHMKSSGARQKDIDMYFMGCSSL